MSCCMGNDCCACVSHGSMGVCWLPVRCEPAVGLSKAVQIIVATAAPAMPRLTQVTLQSGMFPLNRSNGVRWKPSKNHHLLKTEAMEGQRVRLWGNHRHRRYGQSLFLLGDLETIPREKVFLLQPKTEL